ncbi:MAG TPA: oligosaccharide flippase family protein [Candidatus Omnitrophota bacterium]|nr:oligosaccharide flippase family protein [Candidatus Omnitrophota bacterium]
MSSQKVIHQAGWYAAAYTATQFVTMTAAVLTRRFLGPVQVGVWALVQILLSYASYSTLGLANALPREIPFRLGKGETETAARIKQTAFEFVMLMAFLLALGISLYAFINRARISHELFWGLLFASALVILQQLNNCMITLLRCFMNFGLASKQMFLSAIMNALLIAFLSYRFCLYGFMWAMCLSFIFNVGYIFYHEKVLFRFPIRIKLDLSLIRDLMGYGFPLMLLALGETFLYTFDRIVISRYRGLELLGIYSIATMVNGFIYSFPNSVGVVLLPKVAEKFGRTENRHDLKGYLEESNYIFCVLMPLLIGMAWFLLPPFIHWVLPKFANGIVAMKWLVLCSFFTAIAQAYSNFIVVIRKQMFLFPATFLTMALSAGANLWAVHTAGGITSVAQIQILVFAFNFTLLFFLSNFFLGFSAAAVRQYLMVFVKFLWLLCLLFILSKYVRLSQPLGQGLLRTLILIVAYAPFLIQIEKKYNLIRLFLNRLKTTDSPHE